jgi:V/A-type H+-transporting ATPase subunit D
VSDLTPTRSLLIALGDERRTMREGYAFLDEKCLLLAGEMLRQYRQHQAIVCDLAPSLHAARAALAAALARHGLHGLQVIPAAVSHLWLRVEPHPLLGVATLHARTLGDPGLAPAPVQPSPEADACRAAYARVAARLGELSAVSATLARLLAEYRRTVRRVRALQDVLLPELDADIADIETRLEDLERDDALTARGFGRLEAFAVVDRPDARDAPQRAGSVQHRADVRPDRTGRALS